MSLDWRVNDIANYKELCWQATGEKNKDGDDTFRLNPVTDALVWATMTVGIPRITEKNWKEFFVRQGAVDHVCGPALSNRKTGKSMLTEEAIHAHIGLATNASTITAAKFLKNLEDNVVLPKEEKEDVA